MSLREIVIITGSNGGLGFLAAKLLAEKSYHVVITSRTLQKAKDAATKLERGSSVDIVVTACGLDISSAESLSAFGNKMQQELDYVDILINNAAINNDPFDMEIPLDDKSMTAMGKRFQLGQACFTTNVIGTDALVYQILPLLQKSPSPRLLFVSSGVGSMTMNSNPQAEFYMANSHIYRATKAALNMIMVDWHKRLHASGVHVCGVDPGWCATSIGGLDPDEIRKLGARDPVLGAKVVVDAATAGWEGIAGKLVYDDGAVRPW